MTRPRSRLLGALVALVRLVTGGGDLGDDLCRWCGRVPVYGTDLCPRCEEQDRADRAAIDALMDAGHTYHCAARQTWGDGECECQRRTA